MVKKYLIPKPEGMEFFAEFTDGRLYPVKAVVVEGKRRNRKTGEEEKYIRKILFSGIWGNTSNRVPFVIKLPKLKTKEELKERAKLLIEAMKQREFNLKIA